MPITGDGEIDDIRRDARLETVAPELRRRGIVGIQVQLVQGGLLIARAREAGESHGLRHMVTGRARVVDGLHDGVIFSGIEAMAHRTVLRSIPAVDPIDRAPVAARPDLPDHIGILDALAQGKEGIAVLHPTGYDIVVSLLLEDLRKQRHQSGDIIVIFFAETRDDRVLAPPLIGRGPTQEAAFYGAGGLAHGHGPQFHARHRFQLHVQRAFPADFGRSQLCPAQIHRQESIALSAVAVHFQVSLARHIIRNPDMPAPHDAVNKHIPVRVPVVIHGGDHHVPLVDILLGDLELDPPEAVLLIEVQGVDGVLEVGPQDGGRHGILQHRAVDFVVQVVPEDGERPFGIRPIAIVGIGLRVITVPLDAVPHHQRELVPSRAVDDVAVGRLADVAPGRIATVILAVRQVLRPVRRPRRGAVPERLANGLFVILHIIHRSGTAGKAHGLANTALSPEVLQPVIVTVCQFHGLGEVGVGIDRLDAPGDIRPRTLVTYPVTGYLESVIGRSRRGVQFDERDFLAAGHRYGAGSREDIHVIRIMTRCDQIGNQRTGMPGGPGDQVRKHQRLGIQPLGTDHKGDAGICGQRLRQQEQRLARRMSRVGNRHALVLPAAGKEIIISLSVDAGKGDLADGVAFLGLEPHTGEGMCKTQLDAAAPGRWIVVQRAGSRYQHVLLSPDRNAGEPVSIPMGRQGVRPVSIEAHIADIPLLPPCVADSRPVKRPRPDAAVLAHPGRSVQRLRPFGGRMAVGQGAEIAADAGNGHSLGIPFKRAGAGLETHGHIPPGLLFLDTGEGEQQQYEGPFSHFPVTIKSPFPPV